MDPFDDLAGDVAAKLVAAGVPASIDPAAGVPLVLVEIPDGTAAVGIGGWAVALELKLIAAPPADLNARRWLTSTLTTVLATLGFAPWVRRTVTHVGKDCPALVLTYPREVPNPTC